MKTPAKQDAPHRLVDVTDEGLVLVVPPNRLDVLLAAGHSIGWAGMIWAVAIAFPNTDDWTLYVKLVCTLVGSYASYVHGKHVPENPFVRTRFVFGPNGTVLVTTMAGKELSRDSIATAGIELCRRAPRGPGRFEWQQGCASLSMDLCETDLEVLKAYGLRIVPKTPTPMRTRFTRQERKVWWIMGALWSVPWWMVLSQLLFPHFE